MSHCNDSTLFSGKVSHVKLSIMSRGTSYIVIQTHFTSGHSLPPNKRRVFELKRKHKKTIKTNFEQTQRINTGSVALSISTKRNAIKSLHNLQMNIDQ